MTDDCQAAYDTFMTTVKKPFPTSDLPSALAQDLAKAFFEAGFASGCIFAANKFEARLIKLEEKAQNE